MTFTESKKGSGAPAKSAEGPTNGVRRAGVSDTPDSPTRRRRLIDSKPAIRAIQAAILIGFLLSWQFGPQIPLLRDWFPILDPYYISSPTQVWEQLRSLATGQDSVNLWSYVWVTVSASLLGILIGTALGALCGLVLSNSEVLGKIFRPFLVAINAIPRIALIPVVVIILGPTLESTTVTAVMVVFFVVFFNAYEGGRSVPSQVVQNARLLGARPHQVMMQIRFRYVQAWSFAALPNAVSFGLMAVVTAEVLTGYAGLGRLLLDSITTVQASLTFAVVVVLSILGLVLVMGTDALNRRLMHWWSANN